MTHITPSPRTVQRYMPILPLFLLAGIGIAVHLFHTRFGPAVSGDAVQYIAGARNLLQGDGYGMVTGSGAIRPIVAFPPLFPSVLALIGIVGIDPFDGGRYLNAILYGASILLSALLVYRYTGSTFVAVFVGGLILTSRAMLLVHAAVMTEPLFIFLVLLTILVLERYVDTGSERLILLAAAFAAASFLTRYAGASIVGTGLAVIALLSETSMKRRLRQILIFGVVAVTPIVYWMIHNLVQSGTATNRSLSFLMTRTRMALSMGELSSWVLPESIDRRLRILIFTGIAIFVALLIIRQIRSDWKEGRLGRRLFIFPSILTVFIASYLITVGLSMTFLDATMDVIPRHFAPAILATWMLVVGQVYMYLRHRLDSDLASAVAAVAAAGLLIWNGIGLLGFVRDPGFVFGYTDALRVGSGTIDAVSGLEPDTVLITNEIEKVYILTGRNSYRVPAGEESYTQERRADLSQNMEAYWRRLADGAVLVLFDTYAFHQRFPTAADLIDGLSIMVDAEDGTLYVDRNP